MDVPALWEQGRLLLRRDWRQIVLLIGNNQFDVKLGDQNWGPGSEIGLA